MPTLGSGGLGKARRKGSCPCGKVKTKGPRKGKCRKASYCKRRRSRR